jgi:hypothetical protein
MKYINSIILFIGLVINVVLYIFSNENIGIAISRSGEISAVGNINEIGDKDGY